MMRALTAALNDLEAATAKLARVQTAAAREHVVRGGRLALAEADLHARTDHERRRYQDAATRWNSAALEARFPGSTVRDRSRNSYAWLPPAAEIR